MNKKESLVEYLNQQIIQCKKCPRLSSYIQEVAKTKVKRFRTEKYWGKPLPGYGDLQAQILIIGLAPAAHGGNRTGRMFTGDCSGDWLAKVLFENGFATKPSSQSLGDGFELMNSYITAAVRCAPPENKPTNEEIKTCSCYFEQELSLLKNVQVIICLGRIAYDTTCNVLRIKKAKFAHAQMIQHSKYVILCSYHPSRQNTQTGRLEWKQWNEIFVKAKNLLKN